MTSLRINRPTAALISAGALLLAALAVAPQADAATLYACAKKDGQAHMYSKKPRCKKGESIPAGNYIVFAKTVISASAEASTRDGAACELTDTGLGVLDRSQWAGWVVGFLPKVWIGKTTLSLVGAVNTKETTTLLLECTDQSNDINKLSIGGTFSQITAVQTTQNS